MVVVVGGEGVVSVDGGRDHMVLGGRGEHGEGCRADHVKRRRGRRNDQRN